MKYLISSQRKVLRKGAFVEADSKANEFIYDTDTVDDQKEVTVAVLKSICDNNNIHSPKGATRADMISNLNTNLPSLDVPEQKTMSQSAIIKEIVSSAGAARKPGVDADVFEVDVFTQCIERLNKDGITFKIKQLGKLVQQEIAEQGFIMSNVQRKKAVYDVLAKAKFAPTEWTEVEAMLKTVKKEVPDLEESKATSLVKRYLKDNELTVPKRAAKEKMSYRDRAIKFMIENCPVTDEALLAFVLAAKKDAAAVGRLESLRDTISKAFAAGVASVSSEEEAEEEETE